MKPEPAEFVVGQPVVEVSLMRPGVISAVSAYRGDYGGSVRYSYDLVDGSRGLNANEIDAVTSMQCTSKFGGELHLVTSGGDLVGMPTSLEYYDLVKAWLKMPKDLIDMSSFRSQYACP